MSNRSARERDPARRISDFVMCHSRSRRGRGERSQRPNPITVPTEVVGSSIGRLSHHAMMSCGVCDGLELVRRPYNARGIMRIRPFEPFSGRAVAIDFL